MLGSLLEGGDFNPCGITMHHPDSLAVVAVHAYGLMVGTRRGVRRAASPLGSGLRSHPGPGGESRFSYRGLNVTLSG